jgi:plastocyanin
MMGVEMHLVRFGRGLAVLALFAGVAACGDDDGDSATTTTTADEGGGGEEAITITAVDYAFEGAPEVLPGGRITVNFDNQGEVAHEIALVEIGDTSLEQFLEDFPPVLEGGPFPDYADQVAVPIETEGGGSGEVTFTIGEGTYALFCALDGDADAPEPAEGEEPEPGEPHYARGMAQTIEVGATDGDADLPEGDATITATDYTFDHDIEAGDTTINFLNDGPAQVHFAGVSVFPEGVDAAAAEAAFEALLASEEDSPPPEGTPEPEDIGFSGVYSTGLGGQFTVPGGFESGRTYLLVCFVSDRSGGPPHAIANKMYKAFTVE